MDRQISRCENRDPCWWRGGQHTAQMAVAEQDMSTAWAGGIIAVHAYQLALMDQKARDTVYADGPDVCISSSYNPVGAKCEAVEGGMANSKWPQDKTSEVTMVLAHLRHILANQPDLHRLGHDGSELVRFARFAEQCGGTSG